MPIIDVELVIAGSGEIAAGLASSLADQLGQLLGAQPGHVWVRVRSLAADRYAENASALGAEELPVFVSVLHAGRPEASVLAAEAAGIARVVAAVTARPPDRVHVEYQPPAAGRIAFGGVLG